MEIIIPCIMSTKTWVRIIHGSTLYKTKIQYTFICSIITYDTKGLLTHFFPISWWSKDNFPALRFQYLTQKIRISKHKHVHLLGDRGTSAHFISQPGCLRRRERSLKKGNGGSNKEGTYKLVSYTCTKGLTGHFEDFFCQVTLLWDKKKHVSHEF